jgi:hypothetical protein
MAEFSTAYQAATNKLPNSAGSNPIARWQALGGFSKNVIKGREFMIATLRRCVDVLPNHGLGRSIEKRYLIVESAKEYPVMPGLLKKITEVLDS